VLHYGTVPKVDLATWRFEVSGAVARPLTLSWDELQAWPRHETVCDIHCVTRWSRYDNVFEGMKFGVGDGSLRRPAHWPHLINPFRPSWGEPYQDIAARMLAMMETARETAAGQEAVCVSHQLPIWVARRMAERKRLWHNPTSRECALGSVTSFTYTSDQLTGISYTVPARRQVTQGDAAQ
jgi:hypothetical protein